MGSIFSVTAMTERTPYAVSKGAILQLTRSLAIEVADKNITVNAILPGPFATEMNLPIMNDPEKYRSFISKIPMGRVGRPEEVAALVAWLASEECSFSTGAVYDLSGGRATY